MLYVLQFALPFRVYNCLPASTERSGTLVQSTTINNNIENRENPWKRLHDAIAIRSTPNHRTNAFLIIKYIFWKKQNSIWINID
jgi:hypothetical protein